MTGLIQSIADNISLIAALIGANYILALVCAIREIHASRTSQASIAWLLSLFFLPFPTALIYLVFGWKAFDDYYRARHQARASRLIPPEEIKAIDRETGQKWPVQIRAAGLPFMSGNRIDLLIDGAQTFDAIFEAIAAAEHSVLVQFYIIRDDQLGQKLARALIAKAKKGVAVRVLYDDVGSNRMPLSFRRKLRAAGVRIAAFNQRHRVLRIAGPMRINYRNHRKIVLVDGRIAFTGGLNVGVEYLGKDKRFGPWRDTHLRLEGPAAHSIGVIFREDWEWATGEELQLNTADALEPVGDEPALVMATGPADRIEACAIAFTDVIAQARKRLWLVSPYFVPDIDARIALTAAALRGVDVRIMLPAKPDHLLVWLASNAHAAAMVERDVPIYRYTKGFLHQKVLLMDDQIATVGSVNFDNRSFAINFELTVWMTAERNIRDVETMLEADFARCRAVTRDDVRNRSPRRQFIEAAAKLLSPIL